MTRRCEYCGSPTGQLFRIRVQYYSFRKVIRACPSCVAYIEENNALGRPVASPKGKEFAHGAAGSKAAGSRHGRDSGSTEDSK